MHVRLQGLEYLSIWEVKLWESEAEKLLYEIVDGVVIGECHLGLELARTACPHTMRKVPFWEAVTPQDARFDKPILG